MLIIYAHPNKEGHCGYALSLLKKHLSSQGIDFEILDLYKMDYDPVLKDREHFTSGKRHISQENQRIQALIKKETRFIFVYPTWWQSTPAILKGFVDRVFTPPFAYQFKKGIPFRHLKGKKAYIITSTGGPRLYTYFFTLDRAARSLSKDVLNFCGIRTGYSIVGRAQKLKQSQKIKIEKAVKKALAYLR